MKKIKTGKRESNVRREKARKAIHKSYGIKYDSKTGRFIPEEGAKPKDPYVSFKIRKALTNADKARKKPIRTYSHETIVIHEMIGLTLAIYDGEKFIPIRIVSEMEGLKLGDVLEMSKKRSASK